MAARWQALAFGDGTALGNLTVVEAIHAGLEKCCSQEEPEVRMLQRSSGQLMSFDMVRSELTPLWITLWHRMSP